MTEEKRNIIKNLEENPQDGIKFDEGKTVVAITNAFCLSSEE